MSEPGLKVVHISPRVQGRGGIESLHTYHRQWPGEQIFVALFDREPEAQAGYINLNFNWRTPLYVMRKRFREALAPHQGSVVIYHNVWGLTLFHDVDGASRRLAFLHANPIYHEKDMRAVAGLIDGAIGVTPALDQAWNRLGPELTVERTAIVHGPVDPPAGLSRAVRKTGEPARLGFAGRIERVHKRLDRLPALIHELQARKFSFRFEVCGDGILRNRLERELGGVVRFHGWVSRDELWRTMARWDAMVFFSDMEGGPIALFEGMSVGLVPFYPNNGGSWADVHTPQIDPICHYPAGDMAALAKAIQEIFSRPSDEIGRLQRESALLMRTFGRESYDASCLGLITRIGGLPRISQVRARRPRLTDWLPLGVVTRFAMGALRRS